jgi:hypothetical protein
MTVDAGRSIICSIDNRGSPYRLNTTAQWFCVVGLPAHAERHVDYVRVHTRTSQYRVEA